MTNAASTWMPLYIGDYLKDTMHLSAEQHGAYILLIMHYWSNGGKVEHDVDYLFNVCSLYNSKDPDKTLARVLRFFEIKDGFVTHKRIDEELKRANKITSARSEAGKKSGEARKRKAAEDQQSLEQSDEQNLNKEGTKFEQNGKPSQSPSHIEKNITTTSTVSASQIVDNSILEAIPPDADLNNILICVPVFSLLLGKKMLSAKEQHLVAEWCERYDIRKLVLPLIDREIKRYKDKNHGKNPVSVAYFAAAVENASGSTMPNFAKQLAESKRPT